MGANLQKIALLVFAFTISTINNVEAKTHRSYQAKAEFKRQHPCPANNLTRGPCSGYIIDHIIALKRGGEDSPNNMQWQTVDDAKQKDLWE